LHQSKHQNKHLIINNIKLMNYTKLYSGLFPAAKITKRRELCKLILHPSPPQTPPETPSKPPTETPLYILYAY